MKVCYIWNGNTAKKTKVGLRVFQKLIKAKNIKPERALSVEAESSYWFPVVTGWQLVNQSKLLETRGWGSLWFPSKQTMQYSKISCNCTTGHLLPMKNRLASADWFQPVLCQTGPSQTVFYSAKVFYSAYHESLCLQRQWCQAAPDAAWGVHQPTSKPS